jgi:hypothetical protein
MLCNSKTAALTNLHEFDQIRYAFDRRIRRLVFGKCMPDLTWLYVAPLRLPTKVRNGSFSTKMDCPRHVRFHPESTELRTSRHVANVPL